MSKKERVKSDIDTLRNALTIIVTAIFGIIGYAVVNYSNLTMFHLIAGVIISVFLYVALFIVAKLYLKSRKELEKMK